MPSRLCAGPAPGVRCTGGRNGSVALVTVRPGSKTAGRCPSCRGSWQRAKDARRPERRTYAEQQRRKEQVQAQPWCSDCGTTLDLTAEHVASVAKTGNEHGELTTLCRPCNSKRGARLARREMSH